MLQLGKLHLQLALGALGPAGEDVKDQGHAVNHTALQVAFQVALLGGRQFVIEQHDIGAVLCCCGGNLVGLAAAGKKAWIGPTAPALDQSDDIQPGRFGQALEFLGTFCVFRGVEIEGDKQRAFAAGGTFKQSRLPMKARNFRPRRPAS